MVIILSGVRCLGPAFHRSGGLRIFSRMFSDGRAGAFSAEVGTNRPSGRRRREYPRSLQNYRGAERMPHGRDQGERSDRREWPSWRRQEEKTNPYGDFSGDHLFGISPIRAALVSGRRTVSELIIQEDLDVKNRDSSGASFIIKRAKELGIKIREFSKHDLNMISQNRPHQGFVLRASPLEFCRLNSGLENPYTEENDNNPCVLVLDEVSDPQNFGALLRTAQFLSVDKVVVCSKNSAPLSPVVSKVSSGAMELMQIYSVDNLMRFIDRSSENGWQIVGTALEETAISLHEAPLDKPTIIVLGNEGHGIRQNVLKRCTHLVKIPGSSDSNDVTAISSLNVSVCGGIILHHWMSGRRRGNL
jgi:21S rRNA (GM2251-2'-O)-methyltransferase